MPTHRELRQQRRSERSSADRLCGELRSLLVLAGLLSESNRKSFKPGYISESSYAKAKVIVELSSFLIELGVSKVRIVKDLQSLGGLNRLAQHLKVLDLDLETVDAINPAKRILMRIDWMMVVVNKDPAVKKWYESGKINPDHPCLLESDVLSVVKALQPFLLYDCPERQVILETTRFSDLLQASARRLKHFFDILLSGDEQMGRLAGKLLSYPSEDAATWGQRLEVLDVLAEEVRFATGSSTHYEYVLAQAFPQLTNQGDELSLGWLLEHGRALAEDTRSRTAWVNNVSGDPIKPKVELREVVPTIFDNSYLEKSNPETYTYIDDLESSHDPRFPLLPLIGVEVESNMTPEIKNTMYNLLQDYVIKKGSGGDFELSAAPVRNPETMKLLYQKLFSAGLVDLFLTNDYSLHWNTQVTNPALLRESLMALSLTGYLTQARLKNLELNGPRTKKEDDGSYYEWKQGDLIFPEQLMIGIDALHAVATAQKAYEQALLVHTNPTSAEAIQELPLTAAQISLAQLYLDFLERHRQIMHTLRFWSGEDQAITIREYQGQGRSFYHAAQVIRAVYPTLKDFLQIDPSQGFTYEELRSRLFPSSVTPELIVAQAQLLAHDMIHEVNKILERVYIQYLERVVAIAQRINQGENVDEVAYVGMFAEFGDMRTTAISDQELAPSLIQRFQYVLRQPRLDADDRQVVTQALVRLSN